MDLTILEALQGGRVGLAWCLVTMCNCTVCTYVTVYVMRTTMVVSTSHAAILAQAGTMSNLALEVEDLGEPPRAEVLVPLLVATLTVVLCSTCVAVAWCCWACWCAAPRSKVVELSGGRFVSLRPDGPVRRRS